MQVRGVQSLVTIDRGRGGRHFIVGASSILTLWRVRLTHGAVMTVECSGNALLDCSGGLVHVQGLLLAEEVWLVGGYAFVGGAVYAASSAAVVLVASAV